MVALIAGCGNPTEADLLSTAKSALDKKDPAAAVVQLKSVLQRNPDSGEARFLLGRALFEGDDAVAAVIELERAHSLKVQQELVLPWLAKAMVVAGQAKKMIDLYGNVALASPKATAELKAAVAAGYVMLGQMDNCEAALKASLAADPRNVSARLQMARLTAGKSAIDDALAQVQALLQDEPQVREARLLQAQLLWISKRDFDGGKRAFEAALAIDPRYPAAYSGLATLLFEQHDLAAFRARVAEMRKALPDRLETRYFEAQVAMLDLDYRSARASIQQLLKAAPNNVRVLQLAAALELTEGTALSAEIYLKKLLEIAPESATARRMLAQVYLKASEPDKALAALRPLIEGNQAGASELALVAEAHLQSGDLARAEDYFKRAANLDPKALGVRTALALTQIAKGNAEAGFADLEVLSATDQSSTYVDLALVAARLRRDEIGPALKALDRLQEKMPGKALPHQLRGTLLVRRGDPVNARKSFDQALAIDPNNFAAISALVSLDTADKRPEDARKRFAALLEREPKNQRAMVAMALLMSATGGKPAEVAELLSKAVLTNPSDPAARIAQIDFLLARHDTKAASAAAQAGVADMPGDMSMLDALGRVQMASGDIRQAIASFGKVAVALPGSARAQIRLAEGFMAAKDFDSAVKPLKRALELSPDSLAARKALVVVAVSRKRFDEGLAIARQLQKDRPNDSIGWQLQSDIHAVQRDWTGAIATMRESVKRAPSTDAAIRLVELYMAAHRKAEADAFVAAWQKDHPQDARLPFHMGASLLLQREFAQSEIRFREVLVMRPDDAMALNNVAWLMVQQNKPGASALAERALRAAPDQANIMDTMALALAAEGETGKAIEWQRKAVSQAPNEAAYRLGLARLLIKGGDKVQAREELEKLSKLGAAFAGQGEVTELLKRL